MTPARQIIAAVAHRHGLQFRDLVEPARFQHIVRARYDAIQTVARDRPDLSSTQIGQAIRLHHTTVLFALGRLTNKKPSPMVSPIPAAHHPAMERTMNDEKMTKLLAKAKRKADADAQLRAWGRMNTPREFQKRVRSDVAYQLALEESRRADAAYREALSCTTDEELDATVHAATTSR